MKRVLMIVIAVLFISVGWAKAQQVPDDLVLEMKTEQPEHRESQLIAPFLAVTILHFPKAKLWVITKVRMVEPNRWTFRNKDIELISREVDGIIRTLYVRKEET